MKQLRYYLCSMVMLCFFMTSTVYADTAYDTTFYDTGLKLAVASTSTFVFNPRKLSWSAMKNGKVIRTGKASGGRNYCPDIRRGCHTPVGSFSVSSKGGPGCRSSRYPLGRGGAEMPYCMFFTKYYAIHGSYDVPNYNASHGCIRVLPSAAQWLNQDFIDVGTGPGLPGIPLSIIMPDKQFTLLDSNSKKTAFLLQAKGALKLDNMQVVCSRVEDYAGSYDGVLSRAFTAVHDFVASTQHLLKKDGTWYAMKGPQYIDEVKAIADFSHNTLLLKVPFLAKERFLTMIKNTGVL